MNVLTDVKAVALNITVINPGGPGFLVAWPKGQAKPATANINFVTGQTMSNQVIVPVGTGGQVSIFMPLGVSSANITVDVAGFFPAASDYVAIPAVRLMDTRPNQTTFDGKFAGIGAMGPHAQINPGAGTTQQHGYPAELWRFFSGI